MVKIKCFQSIYYVMLFVLKKLQFIAKTIGVSKQVQIPTQFETNKTVLELYIEINWWILTDFMHSCKVELRHIILMTYEVKLKGCNPSFVSILNRTDLVGLNQVFLLNNTTDTLHTKGG